MDQNNSDVFIDSTESTSGGNKANFITCSRCGAEFKKDARYCMKCGNLNFANQENEFMKQYAIKGALEQKKGSYINSNANTNTASNSNVTSSGSVTPVREMDSIDVMLKQMKTCMIVNGVLCSLPVILFALLCVLAEEFTTLIVIVPAMLITYFVSVGYQRMLIKAGEPWWSVFVPFYSMYVLYKVAMGNGWLFLTTLIPGIGQIISLVCYYNLGKKFYHSGWLTLFFTPIMVIVIGFSSNGVYSDNGSLPRRGIVDATKKSSVEKKYGAKKAIFTIIVLVGFALMIWLGWDYLVWAYEFFLEQLEFYK